MPRPISKAIQEWLVAPVSVEEAEAENTIDGVPFGRMADEWRELAARLSPLAELWRFRSPDETWTAFPRGGMEGYALVESGVVVDFLITALS